MFPLQHATKTNPEMGGWEYCDWSNYTNSFHPGVDFNSIGAGDADLGDPLIAVCTMRLENDSFSARGFGNHQWWSVIDGPHVGKWVHYAHADSFVFGHNDIGTVVHRGDKIGECGKSGGQQYVHLHFEVLNNQPSNWGYWGGELKTKEAVNEVYFDPIQFCNDYDSFSENHPDSFIESLSEPETRLLNTVRELHYIDHAESIIRVVSGLHANETSIEEWIKEIGAIKSQIVSIENGSH